MEKPLMLVVRDTYKLWANYMKAVTAQAGVPDSYRMVLTFLLRNPGASQKELAAHCGITTASVSQTVKEMGMTGYLRKVTDSEDQRCVKLYLTQKGEACAERIRERIALADEKISMLLTQEGEERIREMMGELARIIEKELPGCCTI
jgi:DNA-binding MarR family transcriptional regulator